LIIVVILLISIIEDCLNGAIFKLNL